MIYIFVRDVVQEWMVNEMKYEHIVVGISNYATESLDDTLSKCGECGFKLVNVTMAQNKYGVEIMYLFFTKEIAESEGE